MWGHASETFMGETRGTAHADVYRGIDESSVLNNIEMPLLLQKMEAGEVDGVTFHVRRRNQQTGVLDETATYTVHSRASWDEVPTLDRSPSYFAEQGREYQTQQVARSILRNRQGVQQSLDNFKVILDNANADPDAAVFMTSAGAAFPHSGVQVTSEEVAGWQRHPSQGSQDGHNWPAGTSAAQTLYDKLAFHSAMQGSVSSASTGSGRQVPADLARMESHRTTATGSSSGSGDYLAPVNTVASNQGIHMSPAPLQQLPTGGQTAYNYPIPPNSAAQFHTPDYDGNELAPAMSHMSMVSPGETGPVSESQQQGYFDSYYGTNASHEGHYGANAGNQAAGQGQYGGYGASETAAGPAPYYPTTSGSMPGYTMNTTLSNPQPLYTMNPDARYTQPSYTMNTALTNPTGGYAQPVPGGSRSQGSTSSSDGIGDELTRVDHHRSATPSPPPAPARKGRR